MAALGVGVVLKQIVSTSLTWEQCRVLHSDTVGIAFEIERTVTEDGTIGTAVTQLFVPWTSIRHIVVMGQVL